MSDETKKSLRCSFCGKREQEVRRMIQAERLRGIPILSDNINGYYLAADAHERERFIKSMRGRASEIEAVAAAVEKAVIE